MNQYSFLRLLTRTGVGRTLAVLTAHVTSTELVVACSNTLYLRIEAILIAWWQDSVLCQKCELSQSGVSQSELAM